ncbi:MAG: cobalamin B12-binding domain-containing protein [Dehalococcoidia bacterium]|nr:cobalamin B12-binding domain-containing protein [Dehalococcoidia bacterium]
MSERIRVLIAKPGLDGHDLGAKYVARALRDAGMEVIYTGLQQTPEQIVAAALQEDVDVIGLSILSGAHLGLVRKVMARLAEAGMADIMVLVGGTIPKTDVGELKALGVSEVFPTASAPENIARFIRERLKAQERHPSGPPGGPGTFGQQ